MSILFITGTSGSGKTTLVHHLRAQLPSNLFEVYDFDENGVPQDADAVWRQKTTDYWLQKAAENSLHKKSTIVCGVTAPSEIILSAKKPNVPVYFGFLKVSDDVLRKRLSARGWDEALIQDNINWAHYLEAEVKKQPHHRILDTTLYSPQQIADEFVAYATQSMQESL